jgi:hypothetical protein
MKNLNKLYYTVWPGKDGLKTTQYLITENKVKVGKIDGHDAYVTYVYNQSNPFYDEDYIVYNVIYDYQMITTESGYKYDKWNFVYINDEDIKTGKHEVSEYVDGKFQPSKMVDINFFVNYKELVYDEVSKPSSINISKKYKEISEKQRYDRAKKDKSEDFGLQYQIDFKECDFIQAKYIKSLEYSTEKIRKELEDLKKLTEEEYNIKSRKEKELWDDIFSDIDSKAIAKRVSDRINIKNETKIQNYKNFIKKGSY